MRKVVLDFLYLEYNGRVERYMSAHMDIPHETGEYTSDILSFFGFDASELQNDIMQTDHVLIEATDLVATVERLTQNSEFIKNLNTSSLYPYLNQISRHYKNFRVSPVVSEFQSLKGSVSENSEHLTENLSCGVATYYKSSDDYGPKVYLTMPKQVYVDYQFMDLPIQTVKTIGINWSLCSQTGNWDLNKPHLRALRRRHWSGSDHESQLSMLDSIEKVSAMSEGLKVDRY